VNKENFTKTWILTPSYVTNTNLYPSSSHTHTHLPEGLMEDLEDKGLFLRCAEAGELSSMLLAEFVSLNPSQSLLQCTCMKDLQKHNDHWHQGWTKFSLRICSVLDLNSNTNNQNDRKKNLLDTSTQKICDY